MVCQTKSQDSESEHEQTDKIAGNRSSFSRSDNWLIGVEATCPGVGGTVDMFTLATVLVVRILSEIDRRVQSDLSVRQYPPDVVSRTEQLTNAF